jgi:hypothetical protein
MMLIETRVRSSAIYEMGLFTVAFVPRGTPVWRFEPGFDHDFSPAQFAALPPLAQKHTHWFCFVSRETGHVILSGDPACFINHAPTPNTGALPSAHEALAEGGECHAKVFLTSLITPDPFFSPFKILDL